MGYIRGFFSKKKNEETKFEGLLDGKLVSFKRFSRNKFRTKTVFSKFFVLVGIAAIFGIVSFKYMKGQELKGGNFEKNGLSESIYARRNSLKNMKKEKIKIGEEGFLVRVAVNKDEWENGLMWVKRMEKGDGMLFDFRKPEDYGFWMKNTLIPLSILFVGKNMKINGAVNMEPCKRAKNAAGICPQYVPKKKYIYVLEINQKKDVSKYIGKKLILINGLKMD